MVLGQLNGFLCTLAEEPEIVDWFGKRHVIPEDWVNLNAAGKNFMEAFYYGEQRNAK